MGSDRAKLEQCMLKAGVLHLIYGDSGRLSGGAVATGK